MTGIFFKRRRQPGQPLRRVDIGRGRLLPADDLQKTDASDAVERLPRRLVAGLAVTLFLAAAILLLTGCATTAPGSDAQAIKIESVRITAAGHFIDLRYRVVDPARANDLLGPGVKPTLTDEASGAVMAVPMTAKLGALRQTRGEQRTDRSYFVLFANTAGIAPGSRVTADLGGMTFAGLIVE